MNYICLSFSYMICHFWLIPSWLWSTPEVTISNLLCVPPCLLPKYGLATSFLCCVYFTLFILIFTFILHFVLKLIIIYTHWQSFSSSFYLKPFIGFMRLILQSFSQGRTHKKSILWLVAQTVLSLSTCVLACMNIKCLVDTSFS